ncbi:MAG: tRNA 2-thiouridine(34) synthase MnmA [Minisyncoccia bacterium]
MKEFVNKRVFVGLSGGVDSAVSAALLKEAGAKVTGVFIKGWYPPQLPCTWRADRRDAMRVAAHLQIPFLTLDASKEYKTAVIDYLIREYALGRTPNPDIMCNREVKFGAFYRYARVQSADFIATGHYARVERGVAGETNLLRGTDPSKDQSYFLWAISKEVLPHLIFPVGNLLKEEVRKYAKRFTLPVATKKDSQGICFLGDISIEDFLKSEIGLTSGIAYDESGNQIGTHGGVVAYTLGERVSLIDAPAGPWYVLAKRIRENELVVSHLPYATSQGVGRDIKLAATNWFVRPVPQEIYQAQYRYHGLEIAGTYDTENSVFKPSESPKDTLSPGQSLVLYRGNCVVGGGSIEA